MRRRTMIQMAGAGAVLMGTGKLLSAHAAEEGRALTSLGVQLWTVRDQLQSDVRRTLADIAAIGYSEVELFGLGAGTPPDKRSSASPQENSPPRWRMPVSVHPSRTSWVVR